MKATDKREIKLPPFKVKHVVSTLSQVHGWGITQLNIPETWKITRGEDITVMVIDTGYTNHSDLKGALIQDRCKSFISSEKDIDDHNGHSSHCIGVIAARDNDIGMVGVAPKCNVISVKVLGADGSGDYESIRNALRYAIKIQPHVISMSLGAYEYDSELHKLVKKLYSMNIPIIAAAGNDGTDNAVNYPGKFPETICVTAFDKNGNPADFNSTGKEADFSAPGVDIYSTWLKNKYASLSGTCTIGDTIIYTNKGPKKIKDIKVGDIVYSLNESILDIQQNKVINNICNGVKQTYKLQTDHNTIYATANHPFLVYDKVIKSKGIRNRYFRELKWKELKDLAKNDLICVPKIIKSNSNIEKIDKLFLEVNDKIIKNRRNNLKIGKPLTITPAFCQFIGAYLGDGYLLHNKYRSAGIGLCVRCGYKQLNKKMPDYYNNIFEKITGLQMSRTANGDLYVYSSYIADFFENIGLGGDCHGKRLPEWVYELPPEYKEALISGIIDSDGWISKRGDFGLQLCNNELLTDIKCLLDMMGVKCSNIKQRKSVGHTFDKSNKKEYTSYYLTSTKIKNINLNLQDATYNQRLNKKNIFEKHNYDYCSNDEKYLKDQNIKLEKIRNINMDDFKEVYDLTVENNHNYIAEGIIIHNSMATPFMAGVVALLLSKHLKQELQTGKNDCKTVDQIKEHLKKYCDDKGISGHDNIWGYGVVDPIKLIKEDMTVNDTKQTGQQIQSLWQKICKLVRGLFNRI